MKKSNFAGALAMSALLMVPSMALAADEVVPATDEDIATFEKAVKDQVRTRDEARVEQHLSSGEAKKSKANFGSEVSAEAKKLKGDKDQLKKQTRDRVRDQEQLREEAREQTQTRQRQGSEAVREQSPTGGQNRGEETGLTGSGPNEEAPQTGSSGGSTGGSGSGQGGSPRTN